MPSFHKRHSHWNFNGKCFKTNSRRKCYAAAMAHYLSRNRERKTPLFLCKNTTVSTNLNPIGGRTSLNNCGAHLYAFGVHSVRTFTDVGGSFTPCRWRCASNTHRCSPLVHPPVTTKKPAKLPSIDYFKNFLKAGGMAMMDKNQHQIHDI